MVPRGFQTLPLVAVRVLISPKSKECLPSSHSKLLHNPPNHGPNLPQVTSRRPLRYRNACNKDKIAVSKKEYSKLLVYSVPLFRSQFCWLSTLLLGFLWFALTVENQSFQLSVPSSVLMASTSRQPQSSESQKVNPQPPEDEADMVSIRVSPVPLDEELTKRMLAGKILAPKTLNRSGVKDAIKQMWVDCEDVSIMEGLGNNYSFTFKTQTEAEMVLEKSPWFVLNHLLSLQEWGEAESASQVTFDLVPFWVQIHGLPIKFLNLDTMRAVVHKVGNVLEIEDPLYEGSLIRPFGRAKIKIDIMKPFWAGRWVETGKDKRIWVTFKYEKLQDLCYKCGFVGHDQKSCNKTKVMASFDKTKPKFGPFLSTYPPKPLGMLMLERIAFKARAVALGAREYEFGKSGKQGSKDEDLMDEGQGSSDSNKGNEQVRGDVERRNEQVSNERGNQYNEVSQKNKQVAGSTASALFSDIPEPAGVGQGSQEGMGKEAGATGLIDLTGESDHEMENFLPANPNQAMVAHQQWEQGGTSRVRQVNISKGLRPECIVELPIEGDIQQNRALTARLDLATERELILTWNEKFSLKRGRGECQEIEEVEQELFRRKRNKKEEWYDDEGNLLMVKVSTMDGSQSYMIDEWGDLTPPSH